MLAKTPIKQRFYNWVCAQPPEQTYNYQSCRDCACALFLIQELHKNPLSVVVSRQFPNYHVLQNELPENDATIREVWEMFDDIARGNEDHVEWTFGKLRQRIEAQMPECVA